MRPKLATYLLIFLSLSTQFDDAWIASACADTQAATEDDEYLLPSCRQFKNRSALDLPVHTAAVFFSSRLEEVPPTELPLGEVCNPPSLYVFMSLQC
jgi:hypothetical protein